MTADQVSAPTADERTLWTEIFELRDSAERSQRLRRGVNAVRAAERLPRTEHTVLMSQFLGSEVFGIQDMLTVVDTRKIEHVRDLLAVEPERQYLVCTCDEAFASIEGAQQHQVDAQEGEVHVGDQYAEVSFTVKPESEAT